MKRQLSPRAKRALAEAEDEAEQEDFQTALALVRRAQANRVHAHRACNYLLCVRHRRCSVAGEPCIDTLPQDDRLDLYDERVAIDDVHAELVWARRQDAR